jgi:thioredoxin-related protein
VKNVLLQQDWEVVEAYKVFGTPSAVLVRSDGKIGSALAAGPEEIEDLVAQAVGSPIFELPDLSGKMIKPADFRGSETLILFWSPDCGFCNRMLDDLKALEANPPLRAPELLVVSASAVEAKRLWDCAPR